MIRRLLLIAGLLLCGAGVGAQTQNTTVTGTIVGNDGSIWQNAAVSAQGNPPNNLPITTTTSTAGAFTLILPTAISGGTLYQFQVSTQGILPTLGTGPQSFQVSILINGTSQSISPQLSAAAPSLLSATGAITIVNGALKNPRGAITNVKAAPYNAPGDSVSSNNCTTSSTNLNCTDATFTAADVGKRIGCAQASFNGTFVAGTTTISAFVNATNVTLSVTPVGGNQSGICVWGHPDDTAISTAVTAAVAAMQAVGGQSGGNVSTITASPCLYFPAGGYSLFNTAINIAPAASKAGFCIVGDSVEASHVYWLTGSTNGQGAAVNGTANVDQLRIEDITFDGAGGSDTFSNGAIATAGPQVLLNDVSIKRFGAVGLEPTGSFVDAKNVAVLGNQGNNLSCQGCTGEFRNFSASNSVTSNNILIQNSIGSPTAQGVRFFGGLNDECAGGLCFNVNNSTDVWIIGMAMFGAPGGVALQVDGTSHVHMDGGIVGTFNADNNTGAAKILAGGVLEEADVRNISTGTGKCINNAGTYINNGNNSCESLYATVTAISEAVNTVTATVTTQGANVSATCAVGDSVLAQGIIGGGIGYNGFFRYAVTAVGTNTISWTDPTAGLTATSGGNIYCIGMTTFTGTLPYSTLTPTPNTCYVTITPIVSATTYQMCNYGVDRPMNIIRVTASSQNVTTCATAPIVTISNGTVSVTLTITSGKQFWDSFNAQDASTGIGSTVFKPSISTTGTDRITVKYDAGALSACATPPTLFNVTYVVQNVLDNW